MASFNKVILMGRLTADPELKQTPNGAAVTTFNLAVGRRFGENKQCDFITIVAWKQNAEFICKYFKKGQAILVCGELQTRTWKDKDGNNRHATEVVANEVNFCEGKKEAEGNSTSNKQSGSTGKFEPNTYIPQAYTQQSFDNAKDEDLPF